MKLKITMILLSCLMLCSCENGTQSSLMVSRNELETTATTAIGTTSPMSAVTTRNDVPASEEAVKEIMIPTSFTENEEWLHAFIELNFEDAYRFARLESMGCDGDVEVCAVGDDHIEIYGRMNDTGSFANAEKYRESLSEYYSADIVDIFMDNVTIVKKADETDERYYNVEGIDGRIYVEIADEQKHNESTEPVTRLTKYIEIDGVMYKDTGESAHGTQGVFGYSKIVSMTDDEIIFTYPIQQDLTDEFNLIGIAEGRLVKENEKWKFGWHLSDDNFTDAYNDIWYSFISEEIPEDFNDDRTIALRKEKCTQALVDSFQSGIVNEQQGSLEQKIIYSLMDRDVICYYTFRYASSAIEEGARYRDDIFEIKKHALFQDYSELKKFVYDTYSEENAEKLLKEHEPDKALYFSEDQRFLYHAENLGIVPFDIFSEGYEIEITNAGDDEIEFICYYSVWQDEEWKPVEKTALCRAKVIGDQWKLDRNGWLTEQEKILEFSPSSTPQTGGKINREITGLDFEALNANEAIFGQWSKDSFTFDTFTYAIEYDGETYTTETDPERFNENFRCMEGNWEKSDPPYKKINFGDRIGEAEVTECSYTCESFDSRDGIRTEPFRAALTLRGTVTLEGVIAYAEEGDDNWNVYADTVLFFPYADSLKESRMPLLHTEKIDTVYYKNGMPAFGFYGETLPFELGSSTDVFYNGKTFGELFGAKKFQEATVQFEEVVQSWMYMNGSGWSPCKAKITKITFDSEPCCNGNELLCPPFNRTLENYNKEWSEDDVIAAWNMTDASEVYMEYTDRLFCDIDHDGSAELLLTAYSTRKMYFFKKTNHRIEMFFERMDIDITNGNVIMPPTDKEIIKTKEVFDFQECHSFKLYHKEGNIYVMGISWRPAVGKTCWVKKLILSNDNIGFDDVFRWGMFTEKDRIASVFEYRQYDCNGNYTHTTQREIDNFLQLLYSGNDETAKDDG